MIAVKAPTRHVKEHPIAVTLDIKDDPPDTRVTLTPSVIISVSPVTKIVQLYFFASFLLAFKAVSTPS